MSRNAKTNLLWAVIGLIVGMYIVNPNQPANTLNKDFKQTLEGKSPIRIVHVSNVDQAGTIVSVITGDGPDGVRFHLLQNSNPEKIPAAGEVWTLETSGAQYMLGKKVE